MSKPDLTGLDESVRKELDAYIAELEAAAVTEPEGQVLPDDIPEPVAKALAEKDDAIAKEREAREAVEARIAKMQDDADTAKYAERAHELQAIIGGDAGEVLKTLANAAPEAFNDLDERLGRTSQQVKLNDRLFKELGSSNTEHNPTEQIATIAADIRKENPALTEAQARAEAWSRNPQLLAESREVS